MSIHETFFQHRGTPAPPRVPGKVTVTRGGKARRLREQRAADKQRQAELAAALALQQQAPAPIVPTIAPQQAGLAPGEARAFQQGFAPPPTRTATGGGLTVLPQALPRAILGLGQLVGGLFERRQPEGALPPNLARFAEPRLGQPGGSPAFGADLLSAITARRQPEGALPPNLAGSIARGGTLPAPIASAQQPPRTVADGNILGQQLLDLAATDPERLRERARFINMSRDRGAQIDVGVALTAESLARGHFPDIMSDAIATRLATLYGYDNVEELMADLGFIPNPDAPGTWLRREPVAPGTFGTSNFGGDGGGGGRGTFIQGAVPRATRGGGFSLGLTSWGIQPGA